MTLQPNPSNRPLIAGLVLVGLVYAVFGMPPTDPTYVDFGDGNYMYISSRLADGIVLYRDIVSPQPPLHLYTGSLVVRLCRLTGVEPLLGLRLYQHLLRLAVGLVAAAIAWRLFRCRTLTVLTYLVYLLLPVGFWWTRGYQSEPLELLPMTLCFWLLLDGPDRPAGRARAALAGVCAAFALATNMTFLPYLCFHGLYLALARRDLILPFLLPLAAITGGGIAYFSAVAGSAFFENVWSNQVGTFPPGRFVWLQRITRDLAETYQIEGSAILAACVGLWFYAIRSKSPQRLYVIWYAVSSMGSIVFTAKGGTRNYIFSLGEPMVAVFAAAALRDGMAAGRPLFGRLKDGSGGLLASSFARFSAGLVLFCALLTLTLNAFLFLYSTRAGRQYELEAERVLPVIQAISLHTQPGDRLLAPPFYAFVTGRVIDEECGETYILAIRYGAEVRDLWSRVRPDEDFPPRIAEAERILYRDMQEPTHRAAFPAIDLFVSIRESLEARELGLVLLNVSPNNFFGNLWILRDVLAAHYTPLPSIVRPQDRLPSDPLVIVCRNERLMGFVPVKPASIP